MLYSRKKFVITRLLVLIYKVVGFVIGILVVKSHIRNKFAKKSIIKD